MSDFNKEEIWIWLALCLLDSHKDARTMKKEKQVQAELPPDVVLKSDSLQKVKA